MAASYPGAIKSFSAITRGVTVVEAALFSDAALEVEAIETELGINVHGSAGSLAERVRMALDYDGAVRGNLKLCEANDTQRRRMRCGVTAFSVDSLTKGTFGHEGTVNFDTVVPNNCDVVLVELQALDSQIASNTIPAFACYIANTGNTNGFNFLVSTGANAPAAAGSSFLLHWIAFEQLNTTAAI